jgi:hypothetical protein
MSDSKLTPSAAVLANLDANPAWLPTSKGETRVVNTLLDDRKLIAEWRGAGPRAVLVRLTVAAEAITPAERVSNWLAAPNDSAFIGAFTRGIRDGSITPEIVTAACKRK